jgi:hypothetical protein
MTKEATERFELICNRFRKMDHRFEHLAADDEMFLINELARMSQDTVKFVGHVVKINPKASKDCNRLELTFSAVFNTDLLKEMGLAFDSTVHVYVDREMGQLKMFDEEDLSAEPKQRDIFDAEVVSEDEDDEDTETISFIPMIEDQTASAGT